MTRKILPAVLPALALTLAAAPARAHAATDPGRRDSAAVTVVVDLSDRMLYVQQGDSVVRSYPVAIGSDAHPTPTGSFTVRRLIWNPRWVPPDAAWARGRTPKAPGSPGNPMGKVKIFFQEPDYYIHGTRDVDSLGQAESHGCVRMQNSAVADVARIVMENGGAPRPPTWWRRVMNRVTHTEEVRLTAPVSVTVRE
ncbi:MAG TPA: L,D-transpeptidase [Longimicrobiaceae bacterium]|nr:L,D-transpeptidase [Longimicrobiaceae bacterium]